MGDDGVDVNVWVNWSSVPLFLLPALAIALFGRHVSGSWTRPWLSVTPAWWLLLLFLLPPLGYVLLVVMVLVHRRGPAARHPQRYP